MANQEAYNVAMEVLEQGLSPVSSSVCPTAYSACERGYFQLKCSTDEAFLPIEEVERIGKEATKAAKRAFDNKKSHKGGQCLIEEYEEKFMNAMNKREDELTHHAFRTEVFFAAYWMPELVSTI